ncbi:MAG: hypothetical protein LUG18_15275 [Candidatus Azobacteroides sp.]|nr:hypothetical protein [Candidatus Azobacteroides sp.]
MTKISRTDLKNRFRQYMKPEESDFANWLDSYWHQDDEIPIEKIKDWEDELAGKADKEILDRYMKLRRVVTAVSNYNALLTYSKEGLVDGDAIVVAKDSNHNNSTTLYILSATTWSYFMSWEGGEGLKAIDEESEQPLTAAELEVKYGDKGIGFEVWCKRAFVKYTKFSEYFDDSQERVSLWHQFNYKTQDNDPAPESSISVTPTSMSARSFAVNNGKLYAVGGLLYIFDGTNWQQITSVKNPPVATIAYGEDVFYGASNGLYQVKPSGEVVRIPALNHFGFELDVSASDFYSLAYDEDVFFAGAGEHCELGVYKMSEDGKSMVGTNLSFFLQYNKSESYWVRKTNSTVWAGSLALPESGKHQNAGLYYWDKTDPESKKFVLTNLTTGNYKDIVEFNGYVYALGESGEGLFKSPVNNYNSFTQVAAGHSFNKGVVIDNKMYLCSGNGLYVMDTNDTMQHITTVGDISGLSSFGNLYANCHNAVKFKDYIFVCHWNGMYAINTTNNKVEYVIEAPNASCEHAIEYNGKLYVGFHVSTGLHIIDVKED